MTESIIIRNLGPIHDVEILDLRPLTVFIGESGSGKSTILKTVALFRWIYKMMSIRTYLKLSGISKSPFRFSFKTYIRNCGFEGYLKADTEIIYSNGNCTIHYTGGKLDTGSLLDLSELSLEKVSFVSDTRGLIPTLIANNAENRSIGFYLRETLEDYILATKEIRDFSIDYLGVRFAAKKGVGGDNFFIEGIDQERPFSIKLEDSSSGTQTIAPLSIIVEYFSRHYDLVKSLNDAVFRYLKDSDRLSEFKAVKDIGSIKYNRVNIHIEEPELSLYPESQRNLINYLVNRCISNGPSAYSMTLMMATHSPYIVNQINLLLLASRKDTTEEGAKLELHDVDVFEIVDGCLNDLKRLESSIIDARPLSDPIAHIYEKYNSLNG